MYAESMATSLSTTPLIPEPKLNTEIPHYDLFTSFRYDPKLLTLDFNTAVNGTPLPYLLFPYHVARLVDAANVFGWPSAIQRANAPGFAETLRKTCDDAVKSCLLPEKEQGLGLRVILTRAGELDVQTHPVRPLGLNPLAAALFNPTSSTPPPQPVFTVTLDTQPTTPSQFTSYKTTYRTHYEAARARAGILDRRELREVVLYNEEGEITEASARCVAFWRDGGWVTPRLEAGGLAGTVRRYLLEQGLMREGIAKKEDIVVGEWVLLLNGWDVTVLGRIVDNA